MKIKLVMLLGAYFTVFQGNVFSQERRAITIIINTEKTAETFDGVGAVSAGASSRLLIDYPEPYRSQVLDFLFKPYFGASLQHLKVEIGGEINSTDGSEPSHMRNRGDENYQRGYEWWLMKEAKKRNPDIILDALAWGAPGWIGEGKYYSREGADYMVNFLLGARKYHNLDINYVGIWNERDFDVAWIKLLRETLDRNGLPSVKIIASDMNGPPGKMWEIADSMVSDPVLKNAVYAIGVHYPHGELPASALQLKAEGKKLWSTEDGEWNWFTMMPYRHLRAQKLNTNYIDRHLTKTEFWSPVTSYYDCLPAPGSGMIKANTPWSGAYEIEKTLWSVAHTTQFAKPGWLYVDSACVKLPGGGSLVTLTNPDRKNVSIIIETGEAEGEQDIIIKPRGADSFNRLSVWFSDDLHDFIKTDDIYTNNGEFHFVAKPRSVYSLTTTNGQNKGTAGSPNPEPFPLPYVDNFDSYPEHATPRYLSDQSGTFEVETPGKDNKVLKQQVYRRGIDWSSTKTVFSVIGDMNMTDTEVSADITFEAVSNENAATPFASVIARCFQGSVWACFMADNPVGYNFRLYRDGTWNLLTADKELANGRITPSGKEWTNLKLRCQSDKITAFIDGQKVCEVSDGTYVRGLAGIGSSFDPVSFDMFQISDIHEK
jgi:hypothetical protein